MIDEVRISRVLRATDRIPDAPFKPDGDTVGLWHFDEDAAAYDKTNFADSSNLHSPARIELVTQDAPSTGGFDGTRGAHTRWADMDYGGFFTSSLGIPKDKASVTPKAISIRLGKDKKHAIAFDTDLLRVSFGWSGDFIKIYNGREGSPQHPDIAGDVKFVTAALAGMVQAKCAERPEGDARRIRFQRFHRSTPRQARPAAGRVGQVQRAVCERRSCRPLLYRRRRPGAGDAGRGGVRQRSRLHAARFEIAPSQQVTQYSVLWVCDTTEKTSSATGAVVWWINRKKDDVSTAAALVPAPDNTTT